MLEQVVNIHNRISERPILLEVALAAKHACNCVAKIRNSVNKLRDHANNQIGGIHDTACHSEKRLNANLVKNSVKQKLEQRLKRKEGCGFCRPLCILAGSEPVIPVLHNAVNNLPHAVENNAFPVEVEVDVNNCVNARFNISKVKRHAVFKEESKVRKNAENLLQRMCSKLLNKSHYRVKNLVNSVLCVCISGISAAIVNICELIVVSEFKIADSESLKNRNKNVLIKIERAKLEVKAERQIKGEEDTPEEIEVTVD